MNVYDFAPDLDLSKEGEGSIFGVRGIEGSDGIVYAKVAIHKDWKDFGCDRCIFYAGCRYECLIRYSDSCIEWGELRVYEQAAIEGGGRRRLGLRPAVVGGT